MRIVHNNVEVFLKELRKEKCIWENRLYHRVDCLPEQKEAISFRVGLMLSAVIDLEPAGQFLLEAVIDCGCDDPDDDPTDAGTQNALSKMKAVHAVAAELGLQVHEGKIEI